MNQTFKLKDRIVHKSKMSGELSTYVFVSYSDNSNQSQWYNCKLEFYPGAVVSTHTSNLVISSRKML